MKAAGVRIIHAQYYDFTHSNGRFSLIMSGLQGDNVIDPMFSNIENVLEKSYEEFNKNSTAYSLTWTTGHNGISIHTAGFVKPEIWNKLYEPYKPLETYKVFDFKLSDSINKGELVEQGEWAVLSKSSLHTVGVHECICDVIMGDENDKKGIFHKAVDTSPDVVKELIDRIPYPKHYLISMYYSPHLIGYINYLNCNGQTIAGLKIFGGILYQEKFPNQILWKYCLFPNAEISNLSSFCDTVNSDGISVMVNREGEIYMNYPSK